jgi:carboxymethylenebutenolidase
MSCEQCTQGYILPGEPAGSMVNGAYFAPAPADAAPSGLKKAIVLLTDIFGLPLKNSKILADDLAKRVGCDVWVPDFFEGASQAPSRLGVA